jgi:thiol-disulfide isomerase/thioredoxin
MSRKALRLLTLTVFVLSHSNSRTGLVVEGFELSMNRKFPTNCHTAATTTMRGRLGHLRPRLWGAAVEIESSSPTSLKAAMKFKNFEEMLLNFGSSLVVVSFSTDLCGPCRLMKKELSRISTNIGDGVKVFSVDTDKFPKLGARYNISVLPTLVVFKEGQIQDRIEGIGKAHSVEERLRGLLKSD